MDRAQKNKDTRQGLKELFSAFKNADADVLVKMLKDLKPGEIRTEKNSFFGIMMGYDPEDIGLGKDRKEAGVGSFLSKQDIFITALDDNVIKVEDTYVKKIYKSIAHRVILKLNQ
jgi:hypothetical protein